ncbi:DUF1989 domain-containing protein [Yinghuangia sp. YIM S09857]|uniref:oxidoreductase n=1 Tax=Yinghuangia sp. YIM S09857 TaxID=3436929 RepID=UPI003F52ADC6
MEFTPHPHVDLHVDVPAREGRAVRVAAGQRLQVVDLEGQQVGDLFAFADDGSDEYLSASHTRAHVSRLFPAVGEDFVTNRRRPILRLVEDDSPNRHDMLIAACDAARYAALGAAPDHASCADNMRQALSALGLTAPCVPQPVNVFMDIPVRGNARLDWMSASTEPGDSITFEALMDCVVVVSACPQDLVDINSGQPTPLSLRVSPAPEDPAEPTNSPVSKTPSSDRTTTMTHRPAAAPTPTPDSHPALGPTSLSHLGLANRLAVAPMSRVSAGADGVPTAEMGRYYAAFAEGGFGLVITEGTYTDALYSQGYRNQPGIVSDAHVTAWAEITARVNAAGSPIVLQIMHAGALSQGNPHRPGTVGPSAVQPRGKMMEEYGGSGAWPIPRAMTSEDIEDALQGVTAAAVNARTAGFQGVEIHAANGYLFDQFLTGYTNLRDDEYGGPLANRVRLITAAVSRVRVTLGPDFVVGVRLSQTKVNDFAHRWAGAEEAEAIFRAVAGAGASYLHVASEGRDWIETATLDGGETITALARRVTGLPVIANGGMHDLDQARSLLEGGHADVLSLGRGALANPDLPHRVASGAPLEPFDHGILQPMANLENARQWRDRRRAA